MVFVIYFSELKGRKVVTLKGHLLGRLNDLIFENADLPRLTKILVQQKGPIKFLIPLASVQKVGRKKIIVDSPVKISLEKNELYVGKNLVDKQIIDFTGRRVVKVNDAVLQLSKELCLLMGVDIGWTGILRWLKLETIINDLLKILGRRMAIRVLSWKDIQPLELSRGKVQLKIRETRLAKLQPEDLADMLEQTSVQNIEKILASIPSQFAANVVASLHLNYQVNLFNQFDDVQSCQVLQLIDSDEAVDILLALSRHKRHQIITCLPPSRQKQLLKLISVSKTPIGSLMTNEYIMANSRDTAKEILNKIKNETEDYSFLDYIYVVNQAKKLVGVFNLHELLLADPTEQLFKFMNQDVIVLHLTTPQTIALKRMVKYKVHSLPVTDSEKKLLGIVTYDNIAEKILKNV